MLKKISETILNEDEESEYTQRIGIAEKTLKI